MTDSTKHTPLEEHNEASPSWSPRDASASGSDDAVQPVVRGDDFEKVFEETNVDEVEKIDTSDVDQVQPPSKPSRSGLEWIWDLDAYIAQTKTKKTASGRTNVPTSSRARPTFSEEELLLAKDGTDLQQLPGLLAIIPHNRWDTKLVYLREHAPADLKDDPRNRTPGSPYQKNGVHIYDVHVGMKQHPTLFSPDGEPMDVWIVDSEDQLEQQLAAIKSGKWGGVHLRSPIYITLPLEEVDQIDTTQHDTMSMDDLTIKDIIGQLEWLGKVAGDDFNPRAKKAVLWWHLQEALADQWSSDALDKQQEERVEDITEEDTTEDIAEVREEGEEKDEQEKQEEETESKEQETILEEQETPPAQPPLTELSVDDIVEEVEEPEELQEEKPEEVQEEEKEEEKETAAEQEEEVWQQESPQTETREETDIKEVEDVDVPEHVEDVQEAQDEQEKQEEKTEPEEQETPPGQPEDDAQQDPFADKHFDLDSITEPVADDVPPSRLGELWAYVSSTQPSTSVDSTQDDTTEVVNESLDESISESVPESVRDDVDRQVAGVLEDDMWSHDADTAAIKEKLIDAHTDDSDNSSSAWTSRKWWLMLRFVVLWFLLVCVAFVLMIMFGSSFFRFNGWSGDTDSSVELPFAPIEDDTVIDDQEIEDDVDDDELVPDDDILEDDSMADLLSQLEDQEQEARTLVFEANLVDNGLARTYGRASVLKIVDVIDKIDKGLIVDREEVQWVIDVIDHYLSLARSELYD